MVCLLSVKTCPISQFRFLIERSLWLRYLLISSPKGLFYSLLYSRLNFEYSRFKFCRNSDKNFIFCIHLVVFHLLSSKQSSFHKMIFLIKTSNLKQSYYLKVSIHETIFFSVWNCMQSDTYIL